MSITKKHLAQLEGETGTASTWSHRGYAKTLEQETVDALTAAGYEAYNVTSDNYDSLEADLNTDFAGMGLDPADSYVIVISGEAPGESSASHGSSISPEIDLEKPPEVGNSSFKYIYRDKTYYMRYVTVTTTDNDGLTKTSAFAMQEVDYLGSVIGNVFITAVTALVDEMIEEIPIGTIASIFTDIPDEEVYVELAPGTLVIIATTEWTLEFIQVWDENTGEWVNAQYSERTISMMYGAGSMHDPVANKPVPVVEDPVYFTTYSYYYYNSEQRKLFAMQAYDGETVYSDGVYRVDFFPTDQNGNIIYGPEGALFTHVRNVVGATTTITGEFIFFKCAV